MEMSIDWVSKEREREQQFQSMQSQSPFILRHFIPFEFSKRAVDLPNSVLPKHPFVPKEDNPLQNMKLRALEKVSDPQFTLTFTNLTNKTYRPKHQIRANRLLEQIHSQKQITLAMFQKTQQQRPQQHNPEHPFERPKHQAKPKSQHNLVQPSVPLKSYEDGFGLGKNSKKRSKTHQKGIERHLYQPAEDEPQQLEEYGNHFRNIRTASTGRLWRSSHQLHREKDSQTTRKTKTLNVRGSRAPNNEVVDHMRRHSLKSPKLLWV